MHVHADALSGSLPQDLSTEARVLLLEGARQLAIADGGVLTLYEMPAARPVRRVPFQGSVKGLAASSLGLVLALQSDGDWVLWLVTEDPKPLQLFAAPGTVAALAASGSYAYVSVAASEGHGSSLSKVDLRQRAIERTTSFDSVASDVAVNAVTGRIVVSAGRSQTLRVLDSDLTPLARHPSRVAPHDDDDRPDRRGHPRDCCCPSCRVPCHDKPSPSDAGEPSDGGHDRPPPGDERDPARPPGQVGVPTDDGGVITADGGRVEHYPPPAVGRRPCGYSLFWEVAALHRYGPYILAVSHGRRQAALLSMEMDPVQEWNFGRSSAHFVQSVDSPTLVMFDRSARVWTHQLLEGIAGIKPGLDRYPVTDVETKTFYGQQTYALSHDKNRPKLPLRTLILPVIEGSQAFSSANLSGFAAFLARTMYPYAREFHVENSFGAMKDGDLDFMVFGAAAAPLKLPRWTLADYYYPTYVPARLELVRASVTAATPVVFDGRESLSIAATAASGSKVKGTVVLPFFAIGFEAGSDPYPKYKFLGTETLTLQLTDPGGTARTLVLKFTPKSIDIADEGAVAGKLDELATYLDDVIKAAETAAGLTTRLFATPKRHRSRSSGMAFGKLLVTIAAASTGGNRLTIASATASVPAGDPMGLANPMLGTMTASDTGRLNRYLENALLLAQDLTTEFIYNNRLFEAPVCTFDAVKSELKTTISISNRYGGIGAAVTMAAFNATDALFATAVSQPNSATSFQTSEALRDRGQLYQDALTAALDRQEQEKKPLTDLSGFGSVLVLPVEPGTVNPADKDAVRPEELWNVGAPIRPFTLRGAEDQTTIEDGKKRIDPSTGKPFQIQAGWSLIYLSAGGKPDNPLIVHELGHVLNFGDLYKEPPNYRDDLAYMGGWAMMDYHPSESHHCGYNKLQAHWVPYGAGTEVDYGRVFPIGLPAPPPPSGGPGTPKTWQLLLVPLELWRDSLVASSRAAFGVGPEMPVAQLANIDLGGDGATFVLVEARQPGARFSKKLPGGGGVLITNGITWNLDERFAHANQYRRPLHLLNPSNILRNAGDRFDLALAPELALKGTVVEVIDKKTVEGDAQVYRIKISRENAEFVDLYFADGNPYYKSPDLWVDWAGDNGPNGTYSDKDADIPKPPLGTPTDQGELIRVHPQNHEHHWLVARVRNRGKVKALDVKLDFYFCDPPGAGDRGKNFKQMGTATIAEVLGGDAPEFKGLRWDVAPGTSGHSCLLVRIEDYKIPEDSMGAALGSDDVWQINNAAQKNVDKYEARRVNPYEPIEFDFSVNNEGVAPEYAYLEPEHLPFGMTLSVSPPRQKVPARSTVLFHCTLELDSRIIAAGCRNDQRFRITAWREHAESTARWGGVEYEIRPREKTTTEVSGTWDDAHIVELKGKVKPNPGGGTARMRLDYTNNQPRWVRLNVAADGTFAWTEKAPSNSRLVEVVAVFDANKLYASSRSGVCIVKAPPIIH